MATFQIAAQYGFTSVEWTDPARAVGTLPSDPGQVWIARPDPGAPSRLNPLAGVQQRRWQCQVGATFTLVAKPFVWNPSMDDGYLDGRLFSWWWVERPGIDDPSVCHPSLWSDFGQSFGVHCSPLTPGHYLIGCRRPREGIALFHFDAV